MTELRELLLALVLAVAVAGFLFEIVRAFRAGQRFRRIYASQHSARRLIGDPP